ncbi:glycoside hydrolase family 31 protein [Mucilaginibacter sp. BJC16-A38]|uniref:glycoside hydrolase family 31 protein n=1 Tax=Mucilaginibacter phenanthrenivorans TaxID=1234842 RepID=UPI0021570E39|nr:glycoside hydrolase family 31 protein [Mucilaginibacter phenanthrenivorans]MCR8559539.1 glycoside hydrolase family 31 protein [Mucilaginibacter phenanthrenivorans]
MKRSLNRSLILKSAAFLIFSLASFQITSASVKSYTKNDNGVVFRLDKGLMNIRICKADIIEVRYTIFNTFPVKNSLVVNNTWKEKSPFTVAEHGGQIVISTSRLNISINKATNAITYTNKKGVAVTSEASENKSMNSATIAGINTYNCNTAFNSPADEALFGLGCHPEDSLSINYKGRNQQMLIKYMTGAIPVMLSTKGYGLLWDNYSASNFYGAEAENSQYKYVSESGKMVDYYFFYGPDFDRIIDLYRTATGKAPMYPKWAFGLFQSQDKYNRQDEILGVKDNYRNNHIPVDAIVQDWYWWSPLPIGSHIMSKERYPDPKAMIDELHKANMHAMISIWPVFGSGTKDFDDLKSKGFLTSITWDNFVTHTWDTYYDAHNPKARQRYWEQARDSVIKRYGWDAWWVDQCEPDNGSLLDERRKADFSVGKGIDYFNTYSLEHSKGLYQGWRKDIAGKRSFLLIRQSFAGEQRNAATLWSSDISCSFASLRNQIPQGINACVSGIPYWTSDIGGYMSRIDKDGIPDWSKPQYRELFTRWFQFGTFSPIMRIHGKGERALFSSNWDDKTKGILLNYDKLRYRLLPYVYSLSARVTNDNYTIMRALAFDFRDDKNVYAIPDQYMFGPAFLVNPVTSQLYTGKDASAETKTRKVYLPKGSKWYNFWTGESLDGGQSVDAPAPIETMPLYVKAGSIVPMGPNVEYANQNPSGAIELRIYKGANGEFKFYEDENDNYNYEKGNSSTFSFKWNDKLSQLTITARKGSFPAMMKTHTFNIVIVKDGHGSDIGISNKADKTVSYAGKQVVVKI